MAYNHVPLLSFIDSINVAPQFGIDAGNMKFGNNYVRIGTTVNAGVQSTVSPMTVTSRSLVQWSRSDSLGGTYVDFAPDSTGTMYDQTGTFPTARYAVKEADLGKWLRVTASLTNARGTTTKSLTQGPIIPVAPTITACTITGNLVPNYVLTATPTATGGTIVSWSYQWTSSGSPTGIFNPIPGATSSTYTVQSGDLDTFLKLTLIATNTGGSSTYTTAATGQVTNGAPKITWGNVQGESNIGKTLTAATTISGLAPITMTYRWQRGPQSNTSYSDIPGAQSSTYVPVAADMDLYIRVYIVASNSFGVDTKTFGPVPVGGQEIIRALGSVGPAGGIIVWDRGYFSGGQGRYLEVAPYGWYNGGADPTFALSANTNTSFGNASPGGYGEANCFGQTMLIVNQNSTPGYAATVSRAYTGGGFTNWCLPTYYAQGAMFNYKAALGLPNSGRYNGANEIDANAGFGRLFGDNSGYYIYKSDTGAMMRPVHMC